MADEKVQTIFVKEDRTAKIRCESCGLVKTVRMEDLGSLAPVVRIRCGCTAVFSVRFEHRKFYRKTTNLEGIYQVLFDERDIPDLSQIKKTINCRIENLSLRGAGLSILGRHRIEKNMRLVLGFTLDNPQRTWIEKIGVVRLVEGAHLGLQFDETTGDDRDLGFYLRS